MFHPSVTASADFILPEIQEAASGLNWAIYPMQLKRRFGTGRTTHPAILMLMCRFDCPALAAHPLNAQEKSLRDDCCIHARSPSYSTRVHHRNMQVPPRDQLLGIDFTYEMLPIARRKSRERPVKGAGGRFHLSNIVQWLCGDAMSLPLPAGTE